MYVSPWVKELLRGVSAPRVKTIIVLLLLSKVKRSSRAARVASNERMAASARARLTRNRIRARIPIYRTSNGNDRATPTVRFPRRFLITSKGERKKDVSLANLSRSFIGNVRLISALLLSRKHSHLQPDKLFQLVILHVYDVYTIPLQCIQGDW